MALSPRLERARRDIEALAARELPVADLVASIHGRIGRAVPSAASYLLTLDPATILPIGGMVMGFPVEACGPFWRTELAGDLLPFVDLARGSLAASLGDVSDERLEASPRYQALLQPAGMRDELRVAFVVGGSCWGVGGWVRKAGASPFSAEEIELGQRISGPVARGLRARMLFERVQGPGDEMALLLVDANDRVVSRNRTLDAWLADLSTLDGIDDGQLPSLILLMAAQARAAQASGGAEPGVRVRGRSGRWATVRASALTGDQGGVVIVIQRAGASELAPWLLEAYGLTPRQIEVVGCIARGEGNRQIAERLELSVHTVKDHVKAIFGKTGVANRGELLCQIYDGGVHGQLIEAVRHVD